MNNVLLQAVADANQRRRLHVPKGDLRLADGRKLRHVIGYSDTIVPQLPVDEFTKRTIIETNAWQHLPTNLIVSASVTETGRWGCLLHFAVSYPDHDPSWEEIKMVTAVIFPPDVDTAMMLPKKSNWVNLRQHCFHVWQLPEEWTIG